MADKNETFFGAAVPPYGSIGPDQYRRAARPPTDAAGGAQTPMGGTPVDSPRDPRGGGSAGGGRGRGGAPPGPGGDAEGNVDVVAALPDAPQLLPQADGIGQGVWRLLYPERTAPPVAGVVLRVTGGVTIIEHPTWSPRRGGAPPEEVRQAVAAIVRPLRLLTNLYQSDVMLLVAPHGALFLVRPEIGAGMILLGQTPSDPRLPQARVSPLLYRLWMLGGGFVQNRHPLVVAIGAVSAIVLWAVVAVFGIVWLTEIVPRLAQALAAWPVTAQWHPWLCHGIAIAVNALECVGFFLVLDRSTRVIGGVLAGVEIPFHIWYGWETGRATMEGLPLHVLAAATGGATAVVPELLLVILIVLAVRLTPLVPSALLHLVMGVREMVAVWRDLAARYVVDEPERGLEPQTVITPDGRVQTVYVRAVGPGCEEEAACDGRR